VSELKTTKKIACRAIGDCNLQTSGNFWWNYLKTTLEFKIAATCKIAPLKLDEKQVTKSRACINHQQVQMKGKELPGTMEKIC